nr:hypothetical protein [Tanacetum cinerariifolium]
MAFDLRSAEDVLLWLGNANMAFDSRPAEDVLMWPGNTNMAFDLRPAKDVLLWPGNANMAFDLRPAEDVLRWPGNANMAFDSRPTEDVLLWPGNANMAFDLDVLPWPDMIHGRMRASKPKTMQDAIEITTKLRNKKISTLVECQTKNKKRLDNTPKNNQNQRQPNKRQNTGRAYTARHEEKKNYNGFKPSSINANTTNTQKGTRASQKATCYECENQGHYRRDCLKRKNQNHENQIKSTKACGVVHAFEGGETEQDLNNIKDEIKA